MSSKNAGTPGQSREASTPNIEKTFRGDLPTATPPVSKACCHSSDPKCIVPDAMAASHTGSASDPSGASPAGSDTGVKPRVLQGQIDVLLIADDPDRIKLVSASLSKAPTREFRLTISPCLGDANQTLAEQHHDIVLIDLVTKEERDCLQANVISHFRRLHDDIPVVALSNTSASDAILRGAQDCVPSDQFGPVAFQRIIENAILRHDLTEQLRHANRLLDRKGRELKHANDLLRQKNGHLKHLYDSAREFVDHVSHEFRTPLTVIKEYATILADELLGPVSPKQREFLEIIDSRTDDLSHLMDDLLDMSRLRAGLSAVDRRDCTVGDIFDRVRATLESKAAKCGVGLSFRVQDTLPRVHCDPDKIGRVLVNLVVNAFKICDNQETIEVWAKAGDTSGEIVIGVTDKGRGIAPEDCERIYDRLQQVGAATNERVDGFGLGLSIARDLVALNFGELNVESSHGRGSTFSFSLPCANPKGLVTRYLQSLEELEESPVPVSVLSLQAVHTASKRSTEALDRFFQEQARRHDFVLRVAPDRWILFLQCDEPEISHATRRWRELWNAAKSNGTETILPDFEFHTRGTWMIPDKSADLVQQLRPDYLTSARNTTESCVLVVDDDRDFANGLNLQLGAAGYSTKTARDAETALEIAAQVHPSAILLDNSLPGMNGIEALEQLKRNPSTQDIPVIMVSANTRLQQEALNRNAKFYLRKPCGFDKIVSALRDVMA